MLKLASRLSLHSLFTTVTFEVVQLEKTGGNMKNTRTIAVLGAVIIFIFALKFGLDELLLAFLVAGAIPGTHYSIPSSFMFFIMTAAMWIILLNFTKLKDFHTYLTNQLTK